MNTSTRYLALLALVLSMAAAPAAFAQTLLTEDFTGALSSANSSGVGNWLFFNGACLTAGTSTSLASPAASIPACKTVLKSYYNHAADSDGYLMGGANGFLGGTSAPSTTDSQIADPVGNGALRFTNGKPFGNQERGAIVSTNAYSTASGIQVTFKTVTYGGTGADGISFYLMDGCVPVSGAIMPSTCSPLAIYPTGSPNVPAIGATGGSLAYTCSNTNGPTSGAGVTYDGLTGAYLGLGIDEYGNFLNQGDNTAVGYGFQPGRIGLRGGGAISWPALNNAYGTNPNDTTKPYYPASMAQTCSSGTGTYDSVSNTCGVCPAIGPTSSTTAGVTTATATTVSYGSSMCNNSTLTTITTDSGCKSSGYVLNYLNGNPICVKSSSCVSPGSYYGSSDSTYANGACMFPPKTSTPSVPAGGPPTLTCTTGQGTYDPAPGLNICAKAPTTNTNFSTGVSTNTVVAMTTPTSTAPPSVTPVQNAMQKTCSSGHLWNYATGSGSPYDAGAATLANAVNTAGILDYAPIPNAYTILPSGHPLYNGSATTRSAATTIFYNLKITSDGFLSLSYAYGGGAYQSVIASQSISASNGAVPTYVRFGFAGSTGGATNVHEIMCFKSAPAVQSGSSAGVNEKQSAKVETGAFAFFAYYDPNNWVGRATANALSTDTSTGNVVITATPTWDASCVLTGGTCNSTGVAGTALSPSSRVILSSNAGAGIAFEWGSLSSTQQNALTAGDATATQYRFNFLRGDRTNEVTSAGTCTGGAAVCFRARTSVLADIVDSSPTWVGPPQSPYTATFKDRLYTAASAQENTGTQNYLQFEGAEQTRPNVVYVGANDGMMHGFRAGAFDATNVFSTATTPNDGQEVLAYLPGSLMDGAGTGGACASLAATGSIVQNIHGVTPAYMTAPACVSAPLDFSNQQYGHNFFVDATPDAEDLFYNGTWHTWLAGGLGAGGSAFYALDITDSSSTTFAESNAANLVIGEWTSANITCVGNTTCGTNMGNSYGTPVIRRLHDGRWAVIWGNGYGSATGDAGIYVMTVDSSGGKLFYYLSTGNTGTANNNGIGNVTAFDLDGDHITDYVYAGDLMGNLWRFDLTSNTESSWAVSPGPLFKTPTGQPITSAVTAVIGPTPAGPNTLMILFGTGRRVQFTNAAPVTLQSATQSLYGVWDWNMSSWNTLSATQFASLSTAGSGLSGPGYTLGQTNLQQEVFTLNADGVTRDIVNPTAICWAGSAACTGTQQFGWYVNLIGSLEQIIYNPQLVHGVFNVNSIVPANNLVNACTNNIDTGFSYAITALTGAAPLNYFLQYNDAPATTDSVAAGMQTNAVGTSSLVTSSTGKPTFVFQTTTGTGGTFQPNLPTNAAAKRLTWIQLR